MAGVINNVGAGAIAAAGAATAGMAAAGAVAEAATEVAEATDAVASADLGQPFAVFPMRQRPSLWQRWATPTPQDIAYDAAVAAHLRNAQAGMLDMGGFILVFAGLAASIVGVMSLIPLTGIVRRAIADVRSRWGQRSLEASSFDSVAQLSGADTRPVELGRVVVDIIEKAVVLETLASATASDAQRQQAISVAQQLRITEAIPLLIYLATQPQFTNDAIVALGELHATQAIPMLRENVGVDSPWTLCNSSPESPIQCLHVRSVNNWPSLSKENWMRKKQMRTTIC